MFELGKENILEIKKLKKDHLGDLYKNFDQQSENALDETDPELTLEQIQEDQRVLEELYKESTPDPIRDQNVTEDFKVLRKLLKWKNLSLYDQLQKLYKKISFFSVLTICD